MKRIAFLGLGIMGRRMSKRLLNAGFKITVWNRTPGKAQDLVPLGAKEAKTPKEAASNKDAVLTMLADPLSVLQTVLGQNGIIEGISKGSLLIDFTTVDPATPKKIHDAMKAKGVHFLESPVTGSKPAAESGELVLMVGGDQNILEGAKLLLKPLSKKIIHMGPVGSGARMKLVNNLIIAGSMQALFEGLTLGQKGGLKHEAMLEVLTSSALSSFLLKMKGIAVKDRNFDPNFSVKHMAKDIHLATEEAHHQCLSLSQLATNHALYEAALAQELGDEDFAALVKITERMSGLHK